MTPNKMKREKKNIFSGGVVSEVFSNIYLFTKLLIINSGLKFLDILKWIEDNSIEMKVVPEI